MTLLYEIQLSRVVKVAKFGSPFVPSAICVQSMTSYLLSTQSTPSFWICNEPKIYRAENHTWIKNFLLKLSTFIVKALKCISPKFWEVFMKCGDFHREVGRIYTLPPTATPPQGMGCSSFFFLEGGWGPGPIRKLQL